MFVGNTQVGKGMWKEAQEDRPVGGMGGWWSVEPSCSLIESRCMGSVTREVTRGLSCILAT